MAFSWSIKSCNLSTVSCLFFLLSVDLIVLSVVADESSCTHLPLFRGTVTMEARSCFSVAPLAVSDTGDPFSEIKLSPRFGARTKGVVGSLGSKAGVAAGALPRFFCRGGSLEFVALVAD